MSGSSASQGAMAFGLDNGKAADILDVALSNNFGPQASDKPPHDASLTIHPGVFHTPTEHNLTQLYPIAVAADLQQHIITVQANGVRKYWCNFIRPGSSPCHFIGTRKQVQSHIRRAHLHELTPFKCTCGRYFVGMPEGIRHVTTKNQGNIYECGVCHNRYARKDYRNKHAKSCLMKSKEEGVNGSCFAHVNVVQSPKR
ncbi:hypothetical protein JB92DRAFT_3020092 [Gautieria morchelliformis]|nr:hypothetical protein JB92DRAFT_3053931 [Gautieria morchelliformis]KAF8487844.1 hypothetical protein JB92DRAFT_3020092 [Gautieria morchelliformis]